MAKGKNKKFEIVAENKKQRTFADKKYREQLIKDILGTTNNDAVVKLDSKVDYRALFELSKDMYSLKKQLVFIINNRDEFQGRIINKATNFLQNFTLLKVMIDDDDIAHLLGITCKGIRKARLFKKLESEFYIYHFMYGDMLYYLFDKNKLQIGDYRIKGLVVNADDWLGVGENKKFNVSLPLLFAHSIEPRNVQYKNAKEMLTDIKNEKLTYDALFNYIFSSQEKQFKGKSLRHPFVFEIFITATLFGAAYEGYPIHLLMIAKPGTGKTRFENAIQCKMQETQNILDGSNSTFRSLVPSFKTSIPEPGFLIKSSRIAIIDEFLRVLLRTEARERENILTALNPLLEWDEREFSSANGKINGKMTAKLIAVSNKVFGAKDLASMSSSFDNSFLSRLVIWFQDQEHIQWVQNKKGMQKTYCKMDPYKWISIYDYMQTFRAKYSEEKIKEIFKILSKFVAGQRPNDIYNSRYLHHFHVLIDGIIKIRCLIEQDASFKAKKEDYTLFMEVAKRLVRNWRCEIDPEDLDQESERLKYLTEPEKHIYDLIAKNDGKLRKEKLEEFLPDIPKEELNRYLGELEDLGIVKSKNHYLLLWFKNEEFPIEEVPGKK